MLRCSADPSQTPARRAAESRCWSGCWQSPAAPARWFRRWWFCRGRRCPCGRRWCFDGRDRKRFHRQIRRRRCWRFASHRLARQEAGAARGARCCSDCEAWIFVAWASRPCRHGRDARATPEKNSTPLRCRSNRSAIHRELRGLCRCRCCLPHAWCGEVVARFLLCHPIQR